MIHLEIIIKRTILLHLVIIIFIAFSSLFLEMLALAGISFVGKKPLLTNSKMKLCLSSWKKLIYFWKISSSYNVVAMHNISISWKMLSKKKKKTTFFLKFCEWFLQHWHEKKQSVNWYYLYVLDIAISNQTNF